MLSQFFTRLMSQKTRARRHQPVRGQRRGRGLQLESLEDRTVPAVVDLTTVGSSGVINDAIFEQVDPQATGTGLIQPFVRIQKLPGTEGVEQGYNTDFRPLEFDEKEPINFTHSIKLNDASVINIQGTKYREFWLDINESKPGTLLSLDQVQISIAGSGSLTGYTADGTYGGQATLVYDMDAAPDGDSRVDLNYILNHGSGSGDMRMLVPDEVFGRGNPFVYLYSHFGDQDPADSGFEEWWVLEDKKGKPPVFDISGKKYEDVKGDGPTADDGVLEGWTINLYEDKNGNGEIDAGEFLHDTTTGPDGSYSFMDLDAYKQYIVAEAQMDGWMQTFGGNLGNDYYTIVNLNNDITGLDFGNFELIDITGRKFEDLSEDGIIDPGEEGIDGVTIKLYLDDGNGVLDGNDDLVAMAVTATVDGVVGFYSFIDLGPGTYHVEETIPAGWMPTVPSDGVHTVTVCSGLDETFNFGNVQIPGGGGHTPGFWSNQNGQAIIDQLGGWDTVNDSLAGLYLRNADGSLFDVANSTYDEFRTWLLSGNATNMAYMLSVQAAAMQLNVLAGAADLTESGNRFVNGGALLIAPGVNDPNGDGYITVNEVLYEAARILHGNDLVGEPAEYVILTDGDADRPYAELIKTTLDRANNNQNFVNFVA